MKNIFRDISLCFFSVTHLQIMHEQIHHFPSARIFMLLILFNFILSFSASPWIIAFLGE